MSKRIGTKKWYFGQPKLMSSKEKYKHSDIIDYEQGILYTHDMRKKCQIMFNIHTNKDLPLESNETNFYIHVNKTTIKRVVRVLTKLYEYNKKIQKEYDEVRKELIKAEYAICKNEDRYNKNPKYKYGVLYEYDKHYGTVLTSGYIEPKPIKHLTFETVCLPTEMTFILGKKFDRVASRRKKIHGTINKIEKILQNALIVDLLPEKIVENESIVLSLGDRKYLFCGAKKDDSYQNELHWKFISKITSISTIEVSL